MTSKMGEGVHSWLFCKLAMRFDFVGHRLHELQNLLTRVYCRLMQGSKADKLSEACLPSSILPAGQRPSPREWNKCFRNTNRPVFSFDMLVLLAVREPILSCPDSRVRY